MNKIENLLELLALHGGTIVSTASLKPNEIDQARAGGRMYVDSNSLGYIWMPSIDAFPDTIEKVEQFEKWFPLDEKLPDKLKNLDWFFKREHTRPNLPSDEEIEAYVVEQPIKEMSIQYRRNLMVNGAKWMRSIASPRIAEMERELQEAKSLVRSITEFADGMKVLDGEALEILKKTARRVLSDTPTKLPRK